MNVKTLVGGLAVAALLAVGPPGVAAAAPEASGSAAGSSDGLNSIIATVVGIVFGPADPSCFPGCPRW